MKCPNCGSEVSAQAVHCKGCGMILPGTAYTQTSVRPGVNRFGYVGTDAPYTGNIAANTFAQTPFQSQQLYSGQIAYGFSPTQEACLTGVYGYPVAYVKKRQMPQEKTLFYSKILTTLLSLHVVLDLLMIIMLLLR